MADKSKGDKFPLLIYRRWARTLRLPALLIAVACGIIWWYAPTSDEMVEYDWMFIVIGVIGALIFLYSLLARQAAYVQCLPNYVKIRTPFMSVVISYKRVSQVRPTELHLQFPPANMKRSQLRLLRPFLGRTAVLLELSGFPIGERRLRGWFPWFMFAAEVTGFVLLVEDWMALSRQINVYTDRWVTRRQERHRRQSDLWR
jgi:hypothetical protein